MGMFEHLGATLTVLRILRGLSQAKLSEKAGIRQTQVSRYETGQVKPQLPQLERLLAALDVGFPEFLFALLHIEQTVQVLESAGQRAPAEALARAAVAAHWNQVTDLHLRLAEAVETAIRQELARPAATRPRDFEE